MGDDKHQPALQQNPPRPYHAKWVVILAVANAAVFLLYMPPFLHFISDGNYAGLIPYMLELFHDGGYPEWALYHPESPTIFHLVSHQFAHAGLFHLGSNLAVLLYVGRPAEHRCRSYLLVVYFLGGGGARPGPSPTACGTRPRCWGRPAGCRPCWAVIWCSTFGTV